MKKSANGIWAKCVHWLKNQKLATKFFLILLTSLILVFAGIIATSRMTDREYNDTIYKQTVQLLTLFAENIQTELNSVADSSFSIIADNVLQEGLSQIRKANNGSQPWIDARKSVDSRLMNLSFLYSDISSIMIQAADSKKTEFWRAASSGISKRLTADQMQAVYEAKGREIWISSEGALFLVRNIREVADLTLESIGILVMQINIEKIVSRCCDLLTAMNMPLDCAISLDNICVYSTRQELAEGQTGENGYSLRQGSNGVLFCVHYAPAGARWSYTAAVPYDNIVRSVRNASRVTTILALAILTVVLLLGTLLNTSIIKDFQMLLNKFDSYAKNTLQLPQENDPYADRDDEIGKLHKKFSQMALERRQMIDEIYIKHQLLLEAQIEQLRGQINPHFLYNTLETIYCLAEMDGNEKIATMASSLGKLLRTTLKEKRRIITIREDLQIAKAYTDIQMLRLGEQMHLKIDVTDEFLEKPIPTMTIQPLVENAVIYGAEEMIDPCEILIYCEPHGEYYDLIVEDNGPGMDDDILEKLENHSVEPSGLGIGLLNIHKRLQLEFTDSKCGLNIQRINGKTRVAVHLPMEVKTNDQTAAGR